MPSRERLGRDPDCEAAALLQRPVVRRPVADLVARPRDLVAARLIGLVGHRASGNRGSGPIRSTLAQPKPKARNFAPTPLGAAQYLAETRNFDGTAVLIFQPAEEGGGGGDAMVKDGLMERFGIQDVYGMHNMPGIAIGLFALRPGPMMAAADRFTITIEGRGGHAARAYDCIDPVLVGSHVVSALQSVVARNVDPLEAAVVSVTIFRAGDAHNVIPQTATLGGTVRTLSEVVRDLCEARVKALVETVASAFGATAQVEYSRGYPVTCNTPERTTFMASVAAEVAGEGAVDVNFPPVMGAEDFSYMLEKRPGAYILLGNGDTAGVHHPAYDFNDAALPYGVSLWVRMIETGMPTQ